MIEGVQIIPLKRIPDERGPIYHMMKCTDPHFRQFGEIYFSTVYPGVVKGWHRHQEMSLNYACVFGQVKLAIYDERENSPTQGDLMEILLGDENYNLVIIPPEIWNSFKGLTSPYAMIANCCTHPHDSSRTARLDPYKNHIPYDWVSEKCLIAP